MASTRWVVACSSIFPVVPEDGLRLKLEWQVLLYSYKP